MIVPKHHMSINRQQQKNKGDQKICILQININGITDKHGELKQLTNITLDIILISSQCEREMSQQHKHSYTNLVYKNANRTK